MATEDDNYDYVIYWETGGKNSMTARELAQFPFDPASWVAFTLLVLGERNYAPMTVHRPQQDRLKAKLIPAGRVKAGLDYETIQ